MKSAKPPAADTPSHRRSQPVRQTRTNPPRSSANVGRASGRDLVGAGSLSDQPIEIFPAITHFADAITALPKELVRHFTLLKEVDAKLFAPEDQLFRLVAAAAKAPLPEPRPSNEASSSIAPGSAPMSAQNSSSGIAATNGPHLVPSADNSHKDLVFDPSNLPRRHLYRQTAIKIQEMLVSLEEKNHVISTANEALQAQLARIDDVWPHLENEFSEETKWGSTTHWAYPENRTGRSSQADRARRDGAAAISAAAQALADEAAARSDARKQAVLAKKASRNQTNNANNAHNHDDEFDDHEGRHKSENKKPQGSKSRKTTEANNVGLGITTTPTTTTTAATPSSNPPQKRRKVEKPTNGVTSDRAMSTVFGAAAPKAKTTSPRATPAPEGPKKRKALPSGSGQSKKSRNGVTPIALSATSSPVLTELPEPKPTIVQPSPAPSVAPVPVPTRARQNSLQSANLENGKARPTSSASNKPNGNVAATPDPNTPQSSAWPRSVPEPKVTKEPIVPIKTEPAKKEPERPEPVPVPAPVVTKKENKPEEIERKSESVPPTPQTATVTTKSGRASKPSTPALASFQDAARSRSSRNSEGTGIHKKTQKKTGSTIHALVSHLVNEDTNSSIQGDEEDAEIDADEPTYCYCNSVSYGEMVACDADGCPREWFHLECVGLKVAPTTKAKWYCEDCKERLKMGGKKVNGR
ncbi:hypothetical protein EDB81DRAFT_787904 [Dactylonectria macrodidyma]|uniref:Chromatin modification-related protein n=1 Tax=Dactylonectria macrodidyma TaxID=307937 RepID=A0A9P9FB59_9HYPO|nr:hypothetical protein EDB81DRAFT_787904 [Dactylonectria macrodidyma]